MVDQRSFHPALTGVQRVPNLLQQFCTLPSVPNLLQHLFHFLADMLLLLLCWRRFCHEYVLQLLLLLLQGLLMLFLPGLRADATGCSLQAVIIAATASTGTATVILFKICSFESCVEIAQGIVLFFGLGNLCIAPEAGHGECPICAKTIANPEGNCSDETSPCSFAPAVARRR